MQDFSTLFQNVNIDNYTSYLDSAFGDHHSPAANLNGFLQKNYIFRNTKEEYHKVLKANNLEDVYGMVLDLTWEMYETARKVMENFRYSYEIFLNWAYSEKSTVFYGIVIDMSFGKHEVWQKKLAGTAYNTLLEALKEIIKNVPEYAAANVHTPSLYLSNCFSGKWKIRTIKREWNEVFGLTRTRNITVLYEEKSESPYLQRSAMEAKNIVAGNLV